MTIKTASRWNVKTVGGYPVRAFERELIRSGKKVLNLTAGDPSVWGFINQPLSKHLVEAAEQGWHTYGGRANDLGLGTSPPLPTQLRNAIVAFEKSERGNDFEPKNIFYGGGCAGAILMVHMALLEEGDEVVTFDPAHYLVGPTNYFPYFKSKVIPCRSIEEDDWRPDLDELREKIGKRTKLVVINNPNNPTGAVYNEKTLKEIVDIAGEYELPIMSDEIYSSITFDGVVAKSTADVAEDIPVIVVNGLAKLFMRTGWKVGYVAFHDPEEKMKELISTTDKVWRLYGGQRRSMPTPILYAAIKAFQGSMDAGREFVRGVKSRRDYSMKRINEIDGLNCIDPKGTFYVFPRIETVGEEKTWKSEVDFLLELAKEKHVTFDAGSVYGKHGFGHFRAVTLPKIDILEDAYNRIEKFMLEHAN